MLPVVQPSPTLPFPVATPAPQPFSAPYAPQVSLPAPRSPAPVSARPANVSAPPPAPDFLRPAPHAPAPAGSGYYAPAPGRGPAVTFPPFPPPTWRAPQAAARPPRRWPLVVSLSAACLLAVLLVGTGILWSGVLAPHDRSTDAGQSTRPVTSASSQSPSSQSPSRGANENGPASSSPEQPTLDEKTELPPMFSPRPGDPSIGAPIG
jgi:hypothetical protein